MIHIYTTIGTIIGLYLLVDLLMRLAGVSP